jgi:hypothetical protein
MKNVVKFLSIFILFSCSPSEEELELRRFGDWKIGNYVDEWGDYTDARFIRLSAYGKQLKGLPGRDSLRVEMILPNGELDRLYFRFYPYNIRSSTFNNSKYDTNFLRCRFKIGNESNIFLIYLYQEPRMHNFYIGAERLDDTKTKNANAQKFRNLIQNEDILKFLCREEGDSYDLYFSDAQRKYALGDG